MSSREASDSEQRSAQQSRFLLQQAEAIDARALVAPMALMAGVCLIALATWLGSAWRSHADLPAGLPQVLDVQRKVLFKATADGGVQVLSLRNGISELAVLRDPSRLAVHDIALDAGGHTLWVLGEHSAWRYDAHSLRPLSRVQVLASNGGARFERVGTESVSVSVGPRNLN